MSRQQIELYERLLRSNPEDHSRDWTKLFQVLPCRIHGPKPTKSGWLKVGYLHARQIHSGMRFQIAIWQSPRLELVSFAPREVILNRDAFRGDHEAWRDIVTFDSQALKSDFLDWSLQIWKNALVEGNGWLPYISQRLSKSYGYYYVTSDLRLKPNAGGSLPWTQGRFGPGDGDPANTPPGTDKDTSGEPGRDPGDLDPDDPVANE